MNKLNLLIVEGNIKKDTELFIKAAGSSVSENLKKLILKLEPMASIKIIHPGDDIEVSHVTKNLIDFPINIHNETLKASTLKTPNARAKISPPKGSQVKNAATLPQRSIFSLNE